LLNDFAKIGVTRDAFLMFYDEFPLNGQVTGFGGGLFNGAQEFAFDKNALEQGRQVTLPNGHPNPSFNVAMENMGTLATPDGNCAGVTCWVAVIPAQPADAGQFDNHHDGTGFMFSGLDFVSFAAQTTSPGDNRIAVWDWTGLGNLDSPNCNACGNLQFGGQLFTGTNPYDDSENNWGVGFLGAQKAGPTPLGDECGAAGLSTGTPQPAKSCPEGGLNTNGDFMTQVSQAQGQLWGAMTTEVNQTFGTSEETHEGAAYWVINTGSFDSTLLYFANNYIPYPNCTKKAFTLTIGTCGGTRDGYANWGTAVNYVTP
jgi:hypothetical protein